MTECFISLLQTEFEFIEKDLIVKCAKLFAEAGCQNFQLGKYISLLEFIYCYDVKMKSKCQMRFVVFNVFVVTGAYSDPNSMFYIPRVKGQCEHEVSKIHASLSSEEETKGKQAISV